MNPELITILTAGAQDINDVPGGVANLTAADIAAIMSKLSVGASKYIRLKLLKEHDQRDDVLKIIVSRVERWKKIEEWRSPRPGFILDLCDMALSEAVEPLNCPQCKGRGGGILKGRYTPCIPCNESGKRKISNVYRAQTMGLTKQQWANRWGRRYIRILAITDGYEGQVYGLKR